MPEANIVEEAAREMGWKPKEEFRGDESKWVEAEEFVRRGENFVGILRADRDKATQQVRELTTQVGGLREALKESQAAIEAFKEYQTAETKRAVEQARRDLTAQLRQARESGNVEDETKILDELAELREVKAAPTPTPAPTPAPAGAPAPDPAFAAWEAANPWFKTSARKRGLVMGIAEEVRAASPNLAGKAFFDKIDEELAKETGEEPPASKVNGGRPSGSGGGSSARAKSYADLPADAKAACASFTNKLVGPTKAFKTEADWQAHYAKQYFAQEQQ